MKKPNLFDYATSELSQDALITWLINWADEQHAETDKELNRCAVSFVRELLGESQEYAVKKVKADKQWKNIDVWAAINDEYFLVIEDKKGTVEHSNQLQRYAKTARKHYGHTGMKISLAYFKMEEQGVYSNVKEAGYRIIKRERILQILGDYITNTPPEYRNDILADYYSYLRQLDADTNSFKTNSLDNWNRHAWQGFYSALKEKIKGSWKEVSSKGGNFLGFWWHGYHLALDDKEFEYYLQLEEKKMVFKLYVKNPDKNQRKGIRELFGNALNDKAEKLGIGIRLYSGKLGKFMSVAELAEEYRIPDADGRIDMQATLNRLKEMERLLEDVDKGLLQEAGHSNV